MKRLTLLLTAVLFLICGISSEALAKKSDQTQQSPTDSIPKKIIGKVKITVKDLMDGSAVDSVYILVGINKGYTDNKGIVEFDSVPAGTVVTITKAGYIAQSKKVKADMLIRIGRREMQSSANNYKNGLYERPIEHFSGSATIVSGNDLRKINPLNFTEALKFYDPSFIVTRDNLNGDDPNVTPSLKIRGSYNFPASATIASQSGSTVTGAQINPSVSDYVASNIANPDQPVVLLNGVQVALQTALDIDINRIEKITILKDAAATSIYGVRGGNGILLIQTKLPQKGNFSVTYSGQVQVTTPDLSSYSLWNAPEKLQLEHDAGYYNNNSSLYQSRLYQVNKGINTNWLEIPTRTGVGSKHSLSLEGGDDDINYGLDFSYNNIEGVMKGSNRRNANFGGYISARMKNVVISNYLSYIRSNASNSTYGRFSEYPRQNPYWDPYDSITGGMTRILEQYTDQGNTVRFYNPAYNGTISTTDETAYSRLSNILGINWTIGHGFSLNGRFGISKQSDEENVFLPPSHTAFGHYTPGEFFMRGKYNQTVSDFLSMEGTINLHYNKKTGLHQFYAASGVTGLESRSESTGVELVGFVTDKLSDLAFGNAYSNQRPETGKIVTRLISGYGNFTYSYDNRYQFEASANADASSQFGENNRVAPHWSAGVSWNLHQERFFHENKILNQLRVRASVGTAGNQYYQSYLGNTSYNYYTDRQYIQGGSNSGTRGIGLGAFLTGFANKDLKAPETEKQNIGVDAVLFQNRLSVRVEAYRNKTNDLVLPVVSPSSTGFINFTYYDNLGAIENKGIEFDANYTIIKNVKKGIIWNIRLNGIRNEDRIIATSEYLDKLNNANNVMTVDQTRPQPHYVSGKSLTDIWAVNSLGIDPATGQEKFLKANGSETFTWDAADKVSAGDMSPDWLGSFGTSVSVKNITAGVYFNYQIGAKYYNQTLADRLENADLTYNLDRRAADNRWTQPGDNALYKPLSLNGMATSPTYATTRFVEDNDFINCSAISVGYAIPQSITEKIKAKNAKLGFVANNVFSSGSMKAEKGIYYPFHRMYSFSITASF
ncbi:MAG TPA: SusC/RagA family TonB-linked outer membrane protein [Chitinophagaceae bacterium]|nr:SusC/RagA family TonB-linked outer membrane protein [Chitinophagaceae bacterium]